MAISLAYAHRMTALDNKLYNKEWLEEQYNNGRTIQSIADELSVHNETVRTKFDKFGIKRRKNIAKDMTGRIFGRLTVIKSVERLPKHKGTSVGLFWDCKCSCGGDTTVSGKNLRQGNIKSCGCLRSDITKKLRKEEALSRYGKTTKKRVINNYKINARKKKRIFNIDDKTFFTLTQMPCYFCGSTPSNICKNGFNNGDFTYNGLDRLDNNLGYESYNVVPCCKRCNLAKHTMTVQEFKQWIELVYNNFNKKVSDVSSDYQSAVVRLN